jgi:flavin reductase (DIM6/NTAB) family NADH-FMN oxidoreductase RutF
VHSEATAVAIAEKIAPLARPAGVAGSVFRQALARCAAGVVVVTMPGPAGLTASSFTSVSLKPPLVSFCVDQGASCWPQLRAAKRFTVNILTEAQAPVATRFATKGVDRFESPTRWHPGPDGAPLLDASAAWLSCERHDIIPIGDHYLVVGLLTNVSHGAVGPPLLYHDGQYGRFRQVS